MFDSLLEKIGSTIIAIGVTVGSFFGATPPSQQPLDQAVGASFETPEVRALFETTLAERITSSATSMTLTGAVDIDGTTFASSTYAFIIDEGTANEEIVLADCTGTTCTNLSRGISGRTGTTTVATLQKEHRRGASVKITDAPSLLFITNVFKGRQNIENKLRYDSAQSFSNSLDIVSRDYVDTLSFGAVPAATESASGFVEISTGSETSASTATGGTGARLVIPSSIATSTYNNGTASNVVVVTKNTGKIDDNFLSSSIVSTSTMARFATSSINIGSFPAYDIGKNIQVITTTGTSTFSVPSGVSKISVLSVGGGGGGGAAANGANSAIGDGGGGGACVWEQVDVTATTSIQVFVGAGGTSAIAGSPTKFGTNGFYHTAGGGSAGVDDSSGTTGGSGGTATGGDINLDGKNGASGQEYSTTPVVSGTGLGGDSCLGYGGTLPVDDNTGNTAQGYGGGGSGGHVSNGSISGGVGTQGLIKISW